MEVEGLVGVHRQQYLQKLETASLENNLYILPHDVFVDLIKSLTLFEFTPHYLYHYVVIGFSLKLEQI